MYDYLLRKYGYNEPIFVSRIQYNNMSENAIRQQIMRLCRENKIKKYDTGIYFIPKQTVFGTASSMSRKNVLSQKYTVTNDGRICGFFTGLQLANDLGFTSQVPSVYEISTNVATRDYRVTTMAGKEVVLLRPRVKITEQNCYILQFFDLLLNLQKYTELSEEETKKTLQNYMKRMNITKKDYDPYLKFYPERIYKCIYDMEVF